MSSHRRLISVLLTALLLLKAAGAQAHANTCEHFFAPQSLIDQLKETRPEIEAGKVPVNNSSNRDVFLRLFGNLPLDLELPLNTASIMSLQSRTGEYRRGIAPIWSSYMTLNGVLDLGGVFGPLSPLGRLGPIGDRPVNPWFWWQKWVMAGAWMSAPRNLFETAGPLNPKTGVLSVMGPDADDWAQGNFNVFGTNSPAGPKGMLGPLGPMGAVMSLGNMQLDPTGFIIDSDTNKVVSSILMPFHQDLRKYDVFEALSAKFTQELSDNWLLDTSYVVDGHLDNNTEKKVFRSTAPNSEITTVLVVPDIGITTGGFFPFSAKRMNFTVRVVTEKGTEIVKSDLGEKSNIVQFHIRKGEKFEVQVIRQGKTYWGEPQNFRLVVTGATSYYHKFLWEDVLGAEFSRLWLSNEKPTELALNYIFVEITRQSFLKYKQAVRAGQVTSDFQPVDYWKSVMVNAMRRYQTIKNRSSTEEELEKNLLTELARSVDRYQKLITVDPLTGEEMLSMWRATMANTVSSAEDMFNLNADLAANIPKNWLNWMQSSLQGFEQMFGFQVQMMKAMQPTVPSAPAKNEKK